MFKLNRRINLRVDKISFVWAFISIYKDKECVSMAVSRRSTLHFFSWLKTKNLDSIYSKARV